MASKQREQTVQSAHPSATLTLLGGFELRVNGAAVALPQRKAKALLAVLACRVAAQTRSQLAALLWDDRDPAQARQSLRQVLSDLRRTVGAEIVTVQGDDVALAPGVDADVSVFEQVAGAAEAAQLERGIALYGGELLEGFSSGSPAFDDWLMTQREHLRRQALDAMRRALAIADLEHERALSIARRMALLDPLNEHAQRALMRLYAQAGRNGDAIKQYLHCRSVLERELGVPPEHETHALYQQILASRRAPNRAAPAPESVVPEPASPVTPGAASAAAVGRAQVRHAAVLALRVVNVSSLTSKLDPEAYAEAERLFFTRFEQRMREFGGEVIARGSDGLSAAFGLKKGRGTECEQAVRAALLCVDDGDTIRWQGQSLQIACAVVSGNVIEGGAGVVGAPLSVASDLVRRLDHAGVVATDAVLRATTTELDRQTVNGDPLAYLIKLGPVSARVDPIIGRQLQLAQLKAALLVAKDAASGQSVLLRGEAGIGKTTLVGEAKRAAADEGFQVVTARVLDFGTAFNEGPIITLIFALLRRFDDDVAVAIDMFAGAAELSAAQRATLNQLAPARLSDADRGLLQALGAEAHRRARLELVEEVLRHVARLGPLLVVVEDIHWAQPVVLEHLASLAALAAHFPLLLLMTTRVEGEPLDPGWRRAMRGAPLLTLDLGVLAQAEGLLLAEQFCARANLAVDEPRRRECVARAAGNPLFLVELLLASNATLGAVPDSVQRVVSVRLDALAPHQRLAAQAAAVLGQRGDVQALKHVADDPLLDLEALEAQRLLQREREAFNFCHALVQEGVYATLLTADRQRLHSRAAAWFAQRDALLHAQHLERANDAGVADAYLIAAQADATRRRREPALQHIQRGLALARTRATRFVLHLAGCRIALDEGDSTVALSHSQKALTEADGDAERVQALLLAAETANAVDRHRDSLAAADEAIKLTNDPSLLASLQHLRGNALFPTGNLQDCLAAHEQSVLHAKAAGKTATLAEAEGGLGDAHYAMGRMPRARQHFANCVQLAEQCQAIKLLGPHLAMLALTDAYCMDFASAEANFKRARSVATSTGTGRDIVLANDCESVMLLLQGQWQRVIDNAERSLSLVRALGARRFEIDMLLHLASAYTYTQRWREARSYLEQVIDVMGDDLLAFNGPAAMAIAAWLAEDETEREAAYARGEALLARGALSHSFFLFYQCALDCALFNGEWQRALRYCEELTAYTGDEPFSLSEFIARFGRVMANHGMHPRSRQGAGAVSVLRQDAEASGMHAAVQMIDRLLARMNQARRG